MAATSSRFATLKITPPMSAYSMLDELVWLKRGEERLTGLAHAAEGEAPEEHADDKPDDVVPVEELKAISRAKLDGVGP